MKARQFLTGMTALILFITALVAFSSKDYLAFGIIMAIILIVLMKEDRQSKIDKEKERNCKATADMRENCLRETCKSCRYHKK